MFVLLLSGLFIYRLVQKDHKVLATEVKSSYWLELHRKSNVEYLYFGDAGKKADSFLLKTFKVKVGIAGEKPTPLPQLLQRDYFLIVDKFETADNLETAHYFLTLDIPVSDSEPYGPVPYLECDGQCNWGLPGAFGLHGVAGDEARLSDLDPGSSGCIRNRDEDIAFLYNTLSPKTEEIRYYIYDK